MKAYVINLDHRNDRMDEMKRANVPCEYERFPATHSDNFLLTEHNRKMRAHLGCWDSHWRLLSLIFDSPNEYALVLEDDAQFVPGVDLDKIIASAPDNWDLLYLGGDNKEMPEHFDENWDIARTVYQTHAYIVNRKFTRTLLTTLENRPYKVDVVFSDALPLGNCYILRDCVAFQRKSFSDIIGQ